MFPDHIIVEKKEFSVILQEKSYLGVVRKFGYVVSKDNEPVSFGFVYGALGTANIYDVAIGVQVSVSYLDWQLRPNMSRDEIARVFDTYFSSDDYQKLLQALSDNRQIYDLYLKRFYYTTQAVEISNLIEKQQSKK